MTSHDRLLLQGLSKHYGRHQVLRDVSLEIERGCFLTLLGPSGSGKTTLLKVLAGFERCSAGRLLLGATDITRLPAERRTFGLVFQGYALFPHMTVAGNVAFPLKVRRWSRQRIKDRVQEMLDMVQLGHLAQRRPAELSGGQQQRVALARALAFEPDLLLLDEPMSALDRKLRGDLQTELRRIHRQLGTTFIYVTHDQDEAMTMSDRVAVMDHGQLMQVGAPDDLYERPDNRFVASFLGRSNFLPVERMRRAEGGAELEIGGAACRFAGPLPDRQDGLALMLRPENLVLAAEPPAPGWNELPGRVLVRTYFGDRTLCEVEVPGVGPVSAYAPPRALAGLAEGDPVRLHWRAEDGALLPAT
ncbi:ABC transporter ATP-binding protein [Geminicoccus roseus]|uniref:ABC transporter ATP-binding protein n=1 Tax=Geminicoccus roseus TaxID=404900 RepID=UPI0004038FF5|nr:ABC transporter ATP-binding protein [Geminicoccus roseus]